MKVIMKHYLCGVVFLMSCVFVVVHGAEKQVPQAVAHTLQSLGMQDTPVEWVDEIGFFQVMTRGGALYIAPSGRHFIAGEWYSVDADGRPINQTQVRQATRANALIASSFPEKDMVRFAAKTPKETLYIFTDPNCGFCRKLHQEVTALNQAGVNVYYIPFPVIREESRQDSINIWCAKDQNTAMTRAKSGGTNEPANCNSPIEAGLALGRELGVSGTPYMIAKNANATFAGFVPAQSLLQRLGVR